MAWVQPSPGAALSEAAIKTFLDGRLARFKLPKRFEIVDELPRMGSGKIDKVSLAARAREAGVA